MSEETPVTETVEEIPAQVDQESEATTEQNGEAEKTATQKRFDELTREKYEARRRADEVAKENEHLRQLINNAQSENPDVESVKELVRQEAAKLHHEQSFNDSCNKIYATGKSEFSDFDTIVENLQLVGMNRDFLEVLTGMDGAHKILHHLGGDFDEAARISSLPPVQMARELARIELKLSSQPKKVSKAPDPISPLSGKSGSTKRMEDMTDAEFATYRREQIRNR